jgi:NAD-dependent dihydropyrimidine dehydrogenase PreA subunit
MKNIVFWFSGSGNSKFVASQIAERVAAVDSDTTLLYIADMLKSGQTRFDLEAGGSVGFVFPTYFWGVPQIVKDFVSKIELNGISDGGVVYQVLTCGGSTGMADMSFSRLLSRRGYKVSYTYSVSMPDNYCILLDLMTPKEQILPLLEKAQEKLDKVIPAIIDQCVTKKSPSGGELMIDRGACPRLKSALLYPLYKYGRDTAPFHADRNCIGCGKCEKVCPMGIISMSEGKPRWEKGKCTQCLACLHHCPVESVQYGNKTKGRLRYVIEKYLYLR